MPVISTVTDSRVRFTVKTGVDINGKDVLKTRSYGNLKPAATDEKAYNLAATLSGLQKHTLMNISRTNQAALEEE